MHGHMNIKFMFYQCAFVNLLQKCNFTVKFVLPEGKGWSPESRGLGLGLNPCGPGHHTQKCVPFSPSISLELIIDFLLHSLD
jgi:hypothetical protein